jgi:hypothetical protein
LLKYLQTIKDLKEKTELLERLPVAIRYGRSTCSGTQGIYLEENNL